MMKRGAILLGLTGLLLSSCIEHEVIPAPVPEVDLNAHFYGVINGVEVELTENVLSYRNESTKAKIILPPPSFSSAVYYSEMLSSQVSTSVKVGLGSVNWDASLDVEPGLSSFNGFFIANNLPDYSNDGTTGFEVTYTDGTNREWKSNHNNGFIKDVEFTGIVQESDESGDYSLFTCHFNCHAYSINADSLALTPPVLHTDSISIENAVYQGWFKR